MENKGFDWNSFVGMILIGGILVWFAYTNQGPDEPETSPANETQTEEVIPEEPVTAEPNETVIPEINAGGMSEFDNTDSLTTTNEVPAGKKQLGFFNPKPEITSSTVLENEHLRIVIDPLGAKISSAQLKEYTRYDGGALDLIEGSSNSMNWTYAINGVPVQTQDLYFELYSSSSSEAVYRLKHTESEFIEVRYSLAEGNDLSYEMRTVGMKPYTSGQTAFNWSLDALQLEKTKDNLQNPTTVYYRQKGDVDNLSARGDDDEDQSDIEWIAFKQQFFSSILTPAFTLPQAQMTTLPLEDEVHTKRMTARMPLPEQASYAFTLSFVPNQYNTLVAYDKGFDEMIPLGWGIFGWVNRWLVIPVFNFFDSLNWNYGIIILVMAVGIKLILLPFQFRSYFSMAKMRVLKPELDEINEKHKDNMKKQQAQMELYRKAGVNPLGGCLPMLFQLPFLIAMFRFFPASFELRGQKFLWADDLSSYDSIATLPFEIPFYGDHVSLFTLLMALSLFFYTRINQQMTPQSGNNQMAQQMKIIQYIMPFMMLFWFNSYASGLSYYYFLANVISFGQQFAIRSFIDEDAIHAKLQENKKKEKPKSKFSQRLESMMKEQQAQRKKK